LKMELEIANVVISRQLHRHRIEQFIIYKGSQRNSLSIQTGDFPCCNTHMLYRSEAFQMIPSLSLPLSRTLHDLQLNPNGSQPMPQLGLTPEETYSIVSSYGLQSSQTPLSSHHSGLFPFSTLHST